MFKKSQVFLFLSLSCALTANASVAPLPPAGIPHDKLTVIQYLPTSSHDEADIGGVLPDQPVTVVTPAKGSIALGLLAPLGALINRSNIADANAKSAAAVQVTVIDGVLSDRVKTAFARHLEGTTSQLAPMDAAVSDGLKVEPYVHTSVDEQKNTYAILIEYVSLWQGGKQAWETRYEYHFPDAYAADLFTSQASPEHAKFNAALDDGMDRLAALIASELKGEAPPAQPRKAAAFSLTWGNLDMGFKGELLADDGQWLVWRSNTAESLPGYGIHIFRKDAVKIK